MIIARDLVVEAGIRTLVSGASFALHPGDKVGLVGQNGAGKTTLLRTLAGLREPTAGTVARSGRIGYLSQEAALPELEHRDATGLERVLAARNVGGVLSIRNTNCGLARIASMAPPMAYSKSPSLRPSV